MLSALRRDQIKRILLENGSITVTDMSRRFSVSAETIRRDLDILQNEGILEKTYGGAVLRSRVSPSIQHETLENIFVESKKLIAGICKKYIHNNDCIFLDHSTTALHICDAINDLRLTVMTNSLKILNYFAENPNINLVSTGGSLLISEYGFFGRAAVKYMSDFHVDKAFVSCASLNIDRGIGDKNEETSELRLKAIRNANEVYLIADHTKFNKVAFVKTCDISEVDYVITDFQPQPEWVTYFKKNKILLRYPEFDKE